MKKKIIISVCVVVSLAIFIGIYAYTHPTHFAYNDKLVIGSTEEEIVNKYGEFYGSRYDEGVITHATYKIRDNTPEWFMSYDNSLWYEIYFENGIAVRVKLREGYIGG